MRRALFWIILGLTALIAATATWVLTADLGVFKPQLEEWVTEATGREFAIDGELSINLDRQTTVIATDVRFANPDWLDTPQMVRAGRAEIRVDTRSLWKGPIRLGLVAIDDVEISLAEREDGPANWILDGRKSADVRKADDSPALPVLFEQIDVNRLHVVVEGPARKSPLVVQVESLNQILRDDGMLELDLNAVVNGLPVSITGEAGSWEALLSGKDIHYKLNAQFDSFRFKSDGRIDDIANMKRPALSFEATGPDINDLLRMLGLEEKDDGDINISGSLTSADDEQPLLLDLNGNFGRLNIKGSGTFSDLVNLEIVDINVQADSPNLGRLLSLFGIDQVRDAPFHLDIDAARNGSNVVVRKAEMLFGGATFDLAATMPTFPTFDDSRISLHIEGPDLERIRYLTGLPGMASGAFMVNANVDTSPDGANLLQVNLETSLGVVEARGTLTDTPGHIGSQLDFKVSGDDLALLGNVYGLQRLPGKAFEITGSAVLEDGRLRITKPVAGKVDGLAVTIGGHLTFAQGLEGSDFDVNIVAPDVAALVGAFGPSTGIPNQPIDVKSKVQVREDGFRFRDTSGSLGTTQVRLEGLLVPRQGLNGSTFTISAGGPAFEEIIDQVGTLKVAAGRFDLSGNLQMLEDAVQFDNVTLKRNHGELSVDLELGLSASHPWMKFDLQMRGSDISAMLAGTERIAINEMPYSIVARGERDGELWSIDNVTLDAGDMNLRAAGELAFGDDKARSLFRFRGIIPDLSAVGKIDDRPMPPQRLDWDVTVSSSDGELRMNDIRIGVGDNEIGGSMLYKSGDVPELTLELLSDSIEIAALLEERTSEPDSESPPNSGRLIPDVAVPFETMKKLNAAVRVKISKLQLDGLNLRDAHLNAELRDGRLDVHDTGFRGKSGILNAHAVVDPHQGEAKVSVNVVAKDVVLGTTNWNLDPAMIWNTSINVDAVGNDLRTLLGNSNGMIFMDVRGGHSDKKRLTSLLLGDLLDEVIGVLNPFNESDSVIQFDCRIVPAKIDNGVMALAPNAFIQTEKMRIAARSTINLKTEDIEAAIQSTPRRGVGVSAGQFINPFIQISGTLAKPRLGVDEKGVLIKGGAAVATGGLSLVATGLWDRVKNSDDACNAAAEAGRKSLHDRFPKNLTNSQ